MKTEGKQQGLFAGGNYLPIVIFCVVCVIISYFMGPGRYIQRILLLIFLWAAASSAFNIIFGYGGQTVFGYMIFVGSGAYTTVFLFKFLGVSPWVGMWGGMVIAVILAFIIGLPTLRLHGAYFAMATAAFPLITVPIINYLGFEEVTIPFTGHGAGSMQFTDMRYYVVIGVVLLTLILMIVRRMECSRFGFVLRAVKQNETAAEAMGVSAYWTKMMAFLLSAGLGAFMGTIYAFGVLYVLTSYSSIGLFLVVRILGICIVGGVGTLWGPVIGAILLVPISEFLNSWFGGRYPGVQDIIYGAALVGAIIYMPEGIWGKIGGAFSGLSLRSVFLKKSVTEVDSKRKHRNGAASQVSFELESIRPGGMERNINGPILRIEGVCKSFGGVSALKDVNIEVPRGKILGIIGPNGAGKTTLFNVVNGYLTPEKGRILFEGKDITHFRPHARCKLGISRTFQVAQIFGNMTVLENIMIGAFNRWGDIDKAHSIAQEVAEQMRLTSRANDKAVGLTILETKNLEFSRALATWPKFLLVDEPMAGLNPEEANRIGETIKAIAQRGITIMVIEHVVQSLVKIADLMVGLDQGRKVMQGTPREVVSNPRIIEAYLGTKWRERHVKNERNHNSI